MYLLLLRLVWLAGVGICVMCGPLFLSELAPYHLRGAFNTQFQVRLLQSVRSRLNAIWQCHI
jgi:hypothetical protein